MSDHAHLESLAIDIAREAGALALRRRRAGVTIAATKSSLSDIVTEADREVEALIRERLAASCPEDGFLGEESGHTPGRSGITWVVDPIDGTVNYAYGIPAYAVSIAAVLGEPDPASWEAVAAVVFNPAVGELFHASRGNGAYLEDQPIRVNSEVSPAGAMIATGFGYAPESRSATLDQLALTLPLMRDLRRIGAASLDLAYVACGRFDGYFERGLNAWDHAAGALLVSEAGGRIGGSSQGRPGLDMTIAAIDPLFGQLHELLGVENRGSAREAASSPMDPTDR